MNSDLFIHAANVLLLLAYSVKDILWLRLFAVASALVAIPYGFVAVNERARSASTCPSGSRVTTLTRARSYLSVHCDAVQPAAFFRRGE